MIGILGDDGPWHVKTPREVLLLCINQFYNNFHFETGDEASIAHGELADLGYLIWVNNIDIGSEYQDDADCNTAHYEIGMWGIFRRYAKLILQQSQTPAIIDCTVDDLIDFVYDAM